MKKLGNMNTGWGIFENPKFFLEYLQLSLNNFIVKGFDFFLLISFRRKPQMKLWMLYRGFRNLYSQ